MSKTTKLYLAGSIDNSSDDGRTWRNRLQEDAYYTNANIEFLNSLDLHDPRERDHNPNEVVSDDLRLLDEADGIVLKYDHDKQCWGTPMEQGYALAVNRRTDDSLPTVVWWDECGGPVGWLGNVNHTHFTVEDTSPWLTDGRCTIGVYDDCAIAIESLLSELGHTPRPHTAVERNEADDEVSVLYEGTPLIEVLEMFADHGIGMSVPRENFDYFWGFNTEDVDATLRFLKTLGVVKRVDGYALSMKDTEQSQRLLERFVCGYDRTTATNDTATAVANDD